MAPEYRRAYRAAATRKSTFERAWAQSFPGLTVHDVKLNDTTRLDEDVQVDFRMSIPRFAEAAARPGCASSPSAPAAPTRSPTPRSPSAASTW